MNVITSHGKEDLATVYIADLGDGGVDLVEFVESLQPPLPRDDKWVLILSVLKGCPVGCLMCDANHSYRGRLTKEEIFAQSDHIVKKRYPDLKVPVKKFKVQFARMGDAALNPHVLEALQELPQRYDAPGLMPCISTIAPHNSQAFFSRLLRIKDELYHDGNFQLQFSVHTTDPKLRDRLIPIKKWDLTQISRFCERWFSVGDRKVGLNFVMIQGYPIDPQVIAEELSPRSCMIKLTPLNPTSNAQGNGLRSALDPLDTVRGRILAKELGSYGFETLLSIGEPEENHIGSNCGQFVSACSSASRTTIPRSTILSTGSVSLESSLP